MAKIRITDLTATSSLSTIDVFPVVNVAEDVTYKINMQDLANNLAEVPSASFAQTSVTSSYPISVTGSTIYSTAPSFGQVNPDYSVFLGYNAGNASTNASNTVAIGNGAGSNAPNSIYSVFLGFSAGNGATDAFDAVFIGNGAGALAYQASESIFVGTSAGGDAYTASYSTFIGYSAGMRARSASYSTLIGYRAGVADAYGVSSIGSNNIIIGNNISLEYGREDSINIAGLIFATGSYRDLNEVYYDGAFSGSANGRVGINQPNPQYSLDVSGSLYVSNGITGSLFGTSSYVTGSIFNSSNLVLSASYAKNGGVTQIVAGSPSITVSPVGGTGIVTVDYAGGGGAFPFTGSAQITGSVGVTGSISITNGSLLGTASWTYNVVGGIDPFPYTGSAIISNSLQIIGKLANGDGVTVSGQHSHAEGFGVGVAAQWAHGEGSLTQIAFGASYAHAEGGSTRVSNNGAWGHAEGNYTLTDASAAHSEGTYTTASGNYSHAEGSGSVTIGIASHAEGLHTVASGSFQHVQGQYNISSSAQAAFIIGNGTSDADRKNLVFATGSVFEVSASLKVTGSFESVGLSKIQGDTVITGSLVVSGSNGAGVFSQGATLIDYVDGISNSGSYMVWRAPFSCSVVALYGYYTGGTAPQVNAARSGSSGYGRITGSNITFPGANAWTAATASGLQNTNFNAGDALQVIMSGSANNQLAVQVDFIRKF